MGPKEAKRPRKAPQAKMPEPGSAENVWKRTKSTPVENERFLRLLRASGPTVDWKHIASVLSGRTAKICRSHWSEALDPTIKKGSWSPDEARLLVQLHAEFDGKWVELSKRISGRPQTQCRNYWKTLTRGCGANAAG